jgi:hypothetical protein
MSDPDRSIRDLLLKGGCNFGRAYDIERMIRQKIGRELLDRSGQGIDEKIVREVCKLEASDE